MISKSAIIPIVAGVVVATAVVLVGAGVWTPFQTQKIEPNEAVAKLLSQKGLTSEGTISFSGELSPAQTGGLGQTGQISGELALKEQINFFDSENPKGVSEFNLMLGAQGVMMEAEGEFRFLGNVIYLVVNKIPSLPIPEEMLSNIKGQWYEIETAGDEPKEELTFLIKITEEIKDLFSQNSLFKIKEIVGEEKVNSKTATHLKVSLSKEELINISVGLIEMTARYFDSEEADKIMEDKEKAIQDIRKSIEENWEKIKETEMNFWISKGNIIRKISFEMESEEGTVSVEFNFSDFGEKIQIEEPANAKPIEELISGIFVSPSMPEVE